MKKEENENNTITLVVPSECGDYVELNISPSESQRISLTSSKTKELMSQCVPVAVSNDYDLLILNY